VNSNPSSFAKCDRDFFRLILTGDSFRSAFLSSVSLANVRPYSLSANATYLGPSFFSHSMDWLGTCSSRLLFDRVMSFFASRRCPVAEI
jgi:hypothetical protein